MFNIGGQASLMGLNGGATLPMQVNQKDLYLPVAT